MKFYSQLGQDKFLFENFFRGMRGGVFVDVGAYDGVALSNTYYFEKELGWQGICIEPNPLAFEGLSQNRNCVLLNCGVGGQEELLEFLEEGFAGRPWRKTHCV